MKILTMADQVRYQRMTTAEIRDMFLLDGLCKPNEINFTYVELDRAVVGYAAPVKATIDLPTYPELRAEYFLERRELGALNIGGAGTITVDGKSFDVDFLDVLYVGRGSKKVTFASKDASKPAYFYIMSYPAHTTYPVALVKKADSTPMETGSLETCNKRTICKYIHQGGAKSCQLVMGVTHLAAGSNWNTMPAHTHVRRSEIYMYFNMPDEARVFHLMGAPTELRPVVMANKDIVASPIWSIHAGVGTQAYSFCWGMGGENQDYSDMDPAPLSTLR